jgi:hypothetical protein
MARPVNTGPVEDLLLYAFSIPGGHEFFDFLPVNHETLGSVAKQMLSPNFCPVTNLLVGVGDTKVLSYHSGNTWYSRSLEARKFNNVDGVWNVYMNLWPHNLTVASIWATYRVSAEQTLKFSRIFRLQYFDWINLLCTLTTVSGCLFDLSHPDLDAVAKIRWHIYSTLSWVDSYHQLGEIVPRSFGTDLNISELQDIVTGRPRELDVKPLLLVKGVLPDCDPSAITNRLYQIDDNTAPGTLTALDVSFATCAELHTTGTGIDAFLLDPGSSFQFGKLFVNVTMKGQLEVGLVATEKECTNPAKDQLCLDSALRFKEKVSSYKLVRLLRSSGIG